MSGCNWTLARCGCERWRGLFCQITSSLTDQLEVTDAVRTGDLPERDPNLRGKPDDAALFTVHAAKRVRVAKTSAGLRPNRYQSGLLELKCLKSQ